MTHPTDMEVEGPAIKRRHPAQYSHEVLDVVVTLVRPRERIHDPFSGPGLRLGRLCDQLGAIFSGGDIEDWGALPEGKDPRVALADALDPLSYPAGDFTTVFSPVYANKRLADYANGPTPATKTRGRRDYGIALGRALHPDNLARFTGRTEAKAREYWALHARAAKHWGNRVIVNVDEPIAASWVQLLENAGYTVTDVIPVYTRRYGGLDNAEKRASYEVVIVAEREHQP